MRIDQPEFLLALPLLVPVALVLARNAVRGRASIQALTHSSEDALLVITFAVKSFFSGLAFLAFMLCCILSLADIGWGSTPVQDERNGLEVVFALDASRSMLAADADPTRFSRALEIAQGLIQALPEVRFGVVVYKGKAMRLVPLTDDRTVLNTVTAVVNPAVLSSPGTDLAAGLEEALVAFPPGCDRGKAIVLLSDGESLSGNPLAVATRAGDRGVPIHSVGIGSKQGSTIRLADGSQVAQENRKPVITRLNDSLLRSIAEASSGRYYSAAQPATLAGIIEDLSILQATQGKQAVRMVVARHSRSFLLAAFIFLALSQIIWLVRWRGRL
jgi:Ca-activated chloride channel family protein